MIGPALARKAQANQLQRTSNQKLNSLNPSGYYNPGVPLGIKPTQKPWYKTQDSNPNSNPTVGVNAITKGMPVSTQGIKGLQGSIFALSIAYLLASNDNFRTIKCS